MALTPQLLKAIKLLELNNIDLDNYLEQEILENPLLEKINDEKKHQISTTNSIDNLPEKDSSENSLSHDKDFEGSASFDTSNLYDTSSSTSIDNIIEETVKSENSLYESIINQINISFKQKTSRLIALSILEFIEPNGYLKITTKELAENLNCNPKDIDNILKILKSFEPIGVFSNTFEEFLALQLQEQNLLDHDMSILLDNLNLLANENINTFAKKFKMSLEVIKNKLDLIKRCKPAPIDDDSNFAKHLNAPDIIVERIKNDWVVNLNEETLPKVVVLSGYWEELSRKKLSKSDKSYLSANFLAGKGLVKALEQRASTILKVAKAIINKQNYSLLQESLKIDDLVDPRMATVSTIMKHVHMGTIDTVFSLLDGQYEFLEAKILESSELVNKSIKDSNLPEEVRVGAIVRKNKVLIPRSNLVFEKDDIVVILSKREQLKDVEDIFRITS